MMQNIGFAYANNMLGILQDKLVVGRSILRGLNNWETIYDDQEHGLSNIRAINKWVEVLEVVKVEQAVDSEMAKLIMQKFGLSVE